MPGKPWWRQGNSSWYVTLNGQQIRLCQAPNRHDREGQRQAAEELTKLAALQESAGDDPIIAAMITQFMQWSKLYRRPKTIEWYWFVFQDLIDHLPVARVSELRPHHISTWIAAHGDTWGDNMRRGAIGAVKRLFNWAVEEGRIRENPIARMKRPPAKRRDVLVPLATHQLLMANVDEPFRNFLDSLWQLGCRPIEVRTVSAAEVPPDLSAWVFPVGHVANKTGRSTGRPKVTYLTPEIADLTSRLMQQNPAGPLYRNSRGKPWTTSAIAKRMDKLRIEHNLPKGICPYAYRHTYATEGVAGGIDVATMAELQGHSSLSMFNRHYGHLDQKAQHLIDARQRARQVIMPLISEMVQQSRRIKAT